MLSAVLFWADLKKLPTHLIGVALFNEVLTGRKAERQADQGDRLSIDTGHQHRFIAKLVTVHLLCIQLDDGYASGHQRLTRL